MKKPAIDRTQKMAAALMVIRAMAETDASGKALVLLPDHVITLCNAALGDR